MVKIKNMVQIKKHGANKTKRKFLTKKKVNILFTQNVEKKFLYLNNLRPSTQYSRILDFRHKIAE